MRRKPPTIKLGAEPPEVARIRECIGQQVPISCSYTRGERPTLVAIENDMCTLQFRSGAIMYQVPIRDLVDDSGYWR